MSRIYQLSYRLYRSFALVSSQSIKIANLSVSSSPINKIRFYQTTCICCKRRKTAEEKKSPKIIQYTKSSHPPIPIYKNMTVAALAEALGKNTGHVFEALSFIENGHFYKKPETIIDNMQIIKEIVKKSGRKSTPVAPPSSVTSVEKENKDVVRQPPPAPENLVKRPPVVTIMGHVDHGKTTLLDYLSNTSVVETEFGGITQHIGAFSVRLKSGDVITFLDTPGHAAFSTMRARGANITDLVVLVVAADDGVMEQTVESIRMANEAGVPILVALNKIDKPSADIERSKKMLIQHGINLEDAGGDVQIVPISALHGTNVDVLAEAIVLQSEIMELKGDPAGLVEGFVIESKTDPSRGKLSTALIKRGTLRKGTTLVAGTAWAKVRAMFDHNGKPIQEAPPSTPVQVLGWRELPSAGDEILEVESEKLVGEIIKWREQKEHEKKQEEDQIVIKEKTEQYMKEYRRQLEAKRKMGKLRVKRDGPRQKEFQNDDTGPRVNVIVKGDVHGSVEAILDVLETYDEDDKCHLDIVHYGVGNIIPNDIELAETFKAIIYAFNVVTPPNLKSEAKKRKVELRNFNVIYKLVDNLKEEINKRLPMMDEEEVLGEANVLQQFEVTEGKKKVPVAGCRCTKGELKKSALFKVVRDGEVIHQGSLHSMRHLKNEVNTIKKDVECGLMFADPFDFAHGDTVVCYQMKKIPQFTTWDPGF